MIDVPKAAVDLDALLASGPVIRLHIEGDRIWLEELGGGGTVSAAGLEAGSLRSILVLLRHEPATAHELEEAIAAIEDALMPVLRLLPSRRCLVTSAPAIRDIAARAEPDDAQVLEIATVERLFNCLADVACGTPAVQLGIPESRDFAATLLFLRELLHHGNFRSVIVMR